MTRSLDECLGRLQTDHVDVFMPHFPDRTTPVAEILAGLDDLIRAGKILHGGLSDFPAWRVAGAATRADVRGFAPLVGLQTEYSMAERSAERKLLPMAQAHGLGVVRYSPLAGGLLTGKYRKGEQDRLSAGVTDVENDVQRAAVVDTVLAVSDDLGTSPVQVSLSWLRRRAALASTSMIPIVGPRSPAHLAEYLLSLDLELSDQHYQRLDAVSATRLGTPHEDVATALSHGFDGDRSLLNTRMPVISHTRRDMTVARIAFINLECPDPGVLARFWATLLGGEVAIETSDFCAVKVDSIFFGASRIEGDRPPTWPSADRSQQVHLDLAADDLDTLEARALQLGATKELEQPSPERSRVLRDPPGHPFWLCLLKERQRNPPCPDARTIKSCASLSVTVAPGGDGRPVIQVGARSACGRSAVGQATPRGTGRTEDP